LAISEGTDRGIDECELLMLRRYDPDEAVSMSGTVEFDVQRSDLEAFSYACRARNRIASREQRFVRVASAFSALGLIVFLLIRPEIDREGFRLVVIGLSLLAVYPLIMRLQLAWQLRHALRHGDWRAMLGRHVLTLTVEGIREQTDVSDTFYRWHAVTDVFSSHDLILFLLSPGSGYFVPSRAFAEPEAGRAFEEQAKRLRTDASGLADLHSSSSSMPGQKS
jgi:hypothetical protein